MFYRFCNLSVTPFRIKILKFFSGIRVVGKNEKLESFKLESFCLSLKEPSEVGKIK